MDALVVLLGLSLAIGVVLQVLTEVLPVKAPAGLTHTLAVIVAIGAAWALDYSVFTAFEQPLRERWMEPVATGVVLVGVAEMVRRLLGAVTPGRRTA